MSSGTSRLSRLGVLHASIAAGAGGVPPVETVRIVGALADGIRAGAAAASIDEAAMPRDWRAIRHRDEVATMTRDGASAAQIAAALHLSTGHVHRIRRQLGIGRTQ